MDLTKDQLKKVFKTLTPVNTEQLFEDMVQDTYDSVEVGWIKVHPAEVIKKFDYIAWEQAKLDYLDQLQKEEKIISFDNEETFYNKFQVDNLLGYK